MISPVLRSLAVAVPVLMSAACSMAPPSAPGELGRQFTATIPGTWMGGDSSSGTEVRMVKQYRPDGTAQGVLMVKQKAPGVSMVMPEIPFTSRWRVKGDVVESYDIKTGVEGLFKPGTVIRDRLVSVSKNRIVARSEKTGGIEVLTRVNSL